MTENLYTSWQSLKDEVKKLEQDANPDLDLILLEAQLLRRQWQADEPSYLRSYLDNGMWGKDAKWDVLVRYAFQVYLCFYLMPELTVTKLLPYLQDNQKLPGPKFFDVSYPGEDLLAQELDSLHWRSEEANQTLIRGQFAPGGQHRKTLPGPGDIFPRLDSGRQPGFTAGGCQV